MNGSVFKRCRCTENTRKNETARTARSCRKEHGSWYFVHDLPAVGGDRSQVKRGGYPTKEDAENALAKSLAKYAQRGVAAERDLASGRQTVADYLRSWIESKKGLKLSTKRSYRTHIANHLIPLLGTVRLDELVPSCLCRLPWPGMRRDRGCSCCGVGDRVVRGHGDRGDHDGGHRV